MRAIAMKCTVEQYRLIEPYLQKENFILKTCSNFEDYPYLVNNEMGNFGVINNYFNKVKNNYDRTVFEEWNENLFLYYCDIVPKKWCIKRTSENYKELNEYFNDLDKNNAYSWKPDLDYYDYLHSEPIYGNCHSSNRNREESKAEGFIEISYEFFINKIVNKTKTNNMSQKLTVKVADVLKIHSIACSDWKTKLASVLNRCDKNQEITFTQAELDEMFNAATVEQKPILELIFGKKVVIDLSKIKTGSIVKIKHTGKHCSGIENIDVNEPVNVVFFKTPYYISPSKNTFVKTPIDKIYTTFEQNGNMVTFSTYTIDYITEVIEY